MRAGAVRGVVIAVSLALGLGMIPAAPASAVAASASVVSAKTADVPLRGINVAGAEFSTAGTPVFDGAASFSYLASRGYTVVRLPFRWESLQPTLSGPLDPSAVAALQTAVADAGGAGLSVVLDVHNYARYDDLAYGETGSFTSADFSDLWTRLSDLFANDPSVMGYGLMNEPHDLPTVDGVTGNLRWQAAQQAALDAIRAKGDVTCVLVSGFGWASMGSWYSATSGQNTPYITDPADNFRWEAHQYWDKGTTGAYTTTYADAVAAASGMGFSASSGDAARTRVAYELNKWIAWLKANGQKGFIGEFGWPSVENAAYPDDAAAWNSLATLFFDRIEQESGDLLWTTSWATGSRWTAGYALQAYSATNGTLAAPLSNAAVLEADAEVARPTPVVVPAPDPAPVPSASPEPTPVPVPDASDDDGAASAAPGTATDAAVVAAAAAAVGVVAAAGADPGDASAASPHRAVAHVTARLTPARVSRTGRVPRLRVRIRSSATVHGVVVVKDRHRTLRARVALHAGRAVVRITKRLSVGTHRLTVRYRGSATVRPKTVHVKLVVRR